MECTASVVGIRAVDLRLLTYARGSSRGAFINPQPLSSRFWQVRLRWADLLAAIVSNLPSQQNYPLRSRLQPPAHAVPSPPLPEPVLDLSILACQRRRRHPTQPSATADDRRCRHRWILIGQVARLRCGLKSSSVSEASDESRTRNVWKSVPASCQRPHRQMRNAWSSGKRSGAD